MGENMERFIEELDGARLVKRWEVGGETYGLFVWYGGHQVRLYSAEGVEVDLFSFGDYNKSVTVDEAEEFIEWKMVMLDFKEFVANHYDDVFGMTGVRCGYIARRGSRSTCSPLGTIIKA